MSDAQAFGFGQFIPGYDFFQQLSQSSKGAALPPFSSWVAPTVSVEEIDKRIDDLTLSETVFAPQRVQIETVLVIKRVAHKQCVEHLLCRQPRQLGI